MPAIRPSRLALAALLAAPAALAQEPGSGPFADQALGKTFEVTPEDLPEPYAEPAVRNPALTIPRGDRRPTAPEGFEAILFAENLDSARQMLALDTGGVLLAEQYAGHLTYLEDTDGDGRADIVSRFAQGFDQPYGLARVPEGRPNAGDILVADVRGIWRVPYQGGVRASGYEIFAPKPADRVPEDQRGPQRPMDHFAVTEQGVFGPAKGHTTRSLAIDPETGRLHVGVGSQGNIAVEPPPQATIQSFAPDGTDQRTVATGVRNPIGLTFHPETGQLWAVVQERDGLGNRLVPDYLASVEPGDFYGWPYAYTGTNPQPQFAERAPEKVEESMVPDLLFEAHSAAMDLVFYTGDQFPEDYRGDAFVALKGSWNRADPTGYKVVRVPFEDGRPVGTYENFLTGFWVEGEDRAVVWGRPADVAVSEDGGLLIADDTGNTVWLVRYVGEEGAATDAEGSTTQ